MGNSPDRPPTSGAGPQGAAVPCSLPPSLRRYHTGDKVTTPRALCSVAATNRTCLTSALRALMLGLGTDTKTIPATAEGAAGRAED